MMNGLRASALFIREILLVGFFLVFGTAWAFDTQDAFSEPHLRAMEAYNKNNFALAAQLLPPFAEQGSSEALYALARMYENSWGVEKNTAKSKAYYVRAARLGHPAAKVWLRSNNLTDAEAEPSPEPPRRATVTLTAPRKVENAQPTVQTATQSNPAPYVKGKKYQWYHPWFKKTIMADSPPAPPWSYRVVEERGNLIIVEATPPSVKEEPKSEFVKSVPTSDNNSPIATTTSPTVNSTPVVRKRETQSPEWRVAEAGVKGGIKGIVLVIVLSIGGVIWWGTKKAYTAVSNSESINNISRTVRQTASVVSEKLSTPEYNSQTYAQALQEIEAGTTDRGLWAKALVSANGDEAKARAAYIKYRVKFLAGG